jgi:hypothetical protein
VGEGKNTRLFDTAHSFIVEEDIESWHPVGTLLLSQERVRTLGNIMRRRTSRVAGLDERNQSINFLNYVS